jgi:hypothetical protein
MVEIVGTRLRNGVLASDGMSFCGHIRGDL